MGTKGDILIGLYGSETIVTPFGRTLNIADNEISRSGRAASGMLRKDIIAKKATINLEYSFIGLTDIEQFIDLYDLETTLSLLNYNHSDIGGTTAGEGTNYDQYYVNMLPFDRTRLVLTGNIWTGLTVVLEEV